MTRAGVLLLLAACASEPPAAPGHPPGTVAGTVMSRSLPLSDAFVYVKQGLEGRRFAVPSAPVVLDQKSNEFVPRVFGLRAGQTLRITSQDYGLHNVTCTPFNNAEFNETLLGEQSLTRVFDKPEVMIQFRCNIHGNMRAWAGVLDHPYFAVTGPDGRFEFRDLPPGDYVIEAWHEYFGSRRAQVTVGALSVPPLRLPF
jgi:plastocyanin